MMEQVKFSGDKLLRYGYTTGSCAAAVSAAATQMLLAGQPVERVHLMTPKGIELDLTVEETAMTPHEVTCAIRKDGGDDPDTTHGLLIFARVTKSTAPGVTIDGGTGVGRVTKPGLDQPVGSAAINSTPRRMIEENVLRVCRENAYDGGIDVEIFVPEGEETAKKTFNPHIGIVGGISILGTSGIVEPMSDRALIDATHVELNVLRQSGCEDLLLTIGNYGDAFAGNSLNIDLSKRVKCSNFIGHTLDSAIALGFKSLLLVGHIGKMVKLGAGIMNTHSHNADARMDVLTTCALNCGVNVEILKQIMGCATTDAALDILAEAGILNETMAELSRRIEKYLDRRLAGHIDYGAVVFTNSGGEPRVLCTCAGADRLLEKWRI